MATSKKAKKRPLKKAAEATCLGPVDVKQELAEHGKYRYTVFLWFGKLCRNCKRRGGFTPGCGCVWTEIVLSTISWIEAERVADLLCRAGCEAVTGREAIHGTKD